MNKTKAQRHNEMLDRIFTPEIERLKRRSEVSRVALKNIREITPVATCGDNDCYLIDAIGHAIDQFIN